MYKMYKCIKCTKLVCTQSLDVTAAILYDPSKERARITRTSYARGEQNKISYFPNIYIYTYFSARARVYVYIKVDLRTTSVGSKETRIFERKRTLVELFSGCKIFIARYSRLLN